MRFSRPVQSILLLDKDYTSKECVNPKILYRLWLKPQLNPHISILHDSDGSSCIIGFSKKGAEHTNKHNPKITVE